MRLQRARTPFLKCLCIYLIALLCSVQAQSRVSQAITATLGNSTALQGQAVRLEPFNLQVVSNETAAVVTFNLTETRVDRVGWIGFGTGTRMSNADMLVLWPSIQGSTVTWILSQRSASGHMLPEANSPQPSTRELSIVPQLTTLQTGRTAYTLVTILRPLTPSWTTDGSAGNALARQAGMEIIYAYSETNPDSEEIDAGFGVHSIQGAIELNLANALRGTIVRPPSTTSNTTTETTPDTTDTTDDEGLAPDSAEVVEQEWTGTDDIVVVHALVGSLAWLFVSPSAILLARLGRNLSGWVKIHQWLQIGLTTLLTIISFILGIVSTNKYSGLHFKSTHQQLGLVLLILVLLQIGLGLYIHRLFDDKRFKRPIRNLLHIVLGLTCSILGFVQIWQGFEAYSDKGRDTPVAIKVIYFIVVVGFSLALIVSSVLLTWQRKKTGLPLKDAAFGLGRTTKNNRAAMQSTGISNHNVHGSPALGYAMNDLDKPNEWQDFGRSANDADGKNEKSNW